MTYKVTVQENGRVVLPAAFQEGSRSSARAQRHQLVLDIVDGHGVIRTELDQLRDIQARFSKYRTDIEAADELSERRRIETASETAAMTEAPSP